MAYFGSSGVQVVAVNPTKYAVDVPANTVISVQFATDLVDATPENLAASARVRETDSGTDVSGTFSYLDKVVKFTPTSLLKTNTNYTLVVLAGKISDITGAKLATNYTSSFTTAIATAVNKPTLQSPADLSVIKDNPSLTWTAVAPTYHLQVSRDKSFTNLVVDSNGSIETAFTPSLDADVQYYWRVKGVDGTNESDWSDAWTFYYGVIESAAVVEEGFTVLGVDPNPGEVFVPATRRAINVTFSNAISEPSVNGRVVVKYEPIDGDPSIAPVEVAATYAVNGEILVITLGEDLRANMVYRVKLNAGILDTSDNGLVEEVEWYFASNITPHYTTVELVRLDIGPFITQFTNWDVEKIIHDVSQWADFIAEDEVSEDNITYYRCFTRYETDNRLLQRAMMDMATRQGEDVRLGDFSVKMDGSLVPDINQATKWVRENLAECERFLRGEKGKARPIFAVKGEAKYPYPFTQRRF